MGRIRRFMPKRRKNFSAAVLKQGCTELRWRSALSRRLPERSRLSREGLATMKASAPASSSS